MFYIHTFIRIAARTTNRRTVDRSDGCFYESMDFLIFNLQYFPCDAYDDQHTWNNMSCHTLAVAVLADAVAATAAEHINVSMN